MSSAGRLGKGLNALFQENYNVSDEVKDGESIIEVNLDDLRVNPYQPRKKFDDQKINELADSIKEHGVFQPIIVKKSTVQGYIIIAGERRYRASKIADKTSIPAIVRDFDDKTMMEIALLENLQRENLSPVEEALAYKLIIDKYNLTQVEVSERVGKSRSHIANMLRILNLPENVQEYISNGQIDFGHAKVLSGLTDEMMIEEYANAIVKDDLTVRGLERLIKGESTKESNENQIGKKKIVKDIQVKYLEEKIMKKLGTNININRNEKGNGKLMIHFANDNDLNRVLELMNLID